MVPKGNNLEKKSDTNTEGLVYMSSNPYMTHAHVRKMVQNWGTLTTVA